MAFSCKGLTVAAMVLVGGLGGVTAALAEGGNQWGARDPVTTCAEIGGDGVPAVEAVAGLVRCEREEITATDELWLMEDLTIQIGSARDHKGRDELMSMPDSDTAKPVHSLRGSWTWVACRDRRAVEIGGGDPSVNCSHARVAKAEGACWVTTFGTWRCDMTGPAASAETGFAPPQ